MLTSLSPGFLLSPVKLRLPTLSTEPGTEVPRKDFLGEGAHNGGRQTGSIFPHSLPSAALPASVLRPESLAGSGVTYPEVALWKGRADR